MYDHTYMNIHVLLIEYEFMFKVKVADAGDGRKQYAHVQFIANRSLSMPAVHFRAVFFPRTEEDVMEIR